MTLMSDRLTDEEEKEVMAEEAMAEKAAAAIADKPVTAERAPGEAVVEAVPPSLIPETAGAVYPPGQRGRGRAPSEIMWLKLRRNRTAMFGLYLLVALYGSAILAGFLAPYKYDDAVHEMPFYPPMLTRIHIFDEEGGLGRPFVYGITPVPFQHATYQDDPTKKYPIRFFVRGSSYHILWIIR